MSQECRLVVNVLPGAILPIVCSGLHVIFFTDQLSLCKYADKAF